MDSSLNLRVDLLCGEIWSYLLKQRKFYQEVRSPLHELVFVQIISIPRIWDECETAALSVSCINVCKRLRAKSSSSAGLTIVHHFRLSPHCRFLNFCSDSMCCSTHWSSRIGRSTFLYTAHVFVCVVSRSQNWSQSIFKQLVISSN